MDISISYFEDITHWSQRSNQWSTQRTARRIENRKDQSRNTFPAESLDMPFSYFYKLFLLEILKSFQCSNFANFFLTSYKSSWETEMTTLVGHLARRTENDDLEQSQPPCANNSYLSTSFSQDDFLVT